MRPQLLEQHGGNGPAQGRSEGGPGTEQVLGGVVYRYNDQLPLPENVDSMTRKKNLPRLILALLPVLLYSACVGMPAPATRGQPERILTDNDVKIVYVGEVIDNPLYYRVDVNDKPMFIFGETVMPSIQSAFLLEHLQFRKGDTVLDLGTGSGIQSLFAAWSGLPDKIVATDLGPDAVRSANYNVQYYKLQDKIEVRQGDLFAPLQKGETFSLIINSIDYPEDPKAVDHPMWPVHERFFAEVKNYLSPKGRIIYQSGHMENIERIRAMVAKNGLVIMEMHMRRNPFLDKNLVTYRIEPAVYPRVTM